jgi:predicted kinase
VSDPAKPTLVIISGMPGSGKSTLARALADTSHWPLLSRDAIYSGLFHTCSSGQNRSQDLAQVANKAFVNAARALLKAGVSIVVEAAFRHKLWVTLLDTLLPLADSRVIRCVIEPELALQRMVRRLEQFPAQRSAHHDARYIHERISTADRPPHFEPLSVETPTLDVETADGYVPGLDTVVNFACSRQLGLTGTSKRSDPGDARSSG